MSTLQGGASCARRPSKTIHREPLPPPHPTPTPFPTNHSGTAHPHQSAQLPVLTAVLVVSHAEKACNLWWGPVSEGLVALGCASGDGGHKAGDIEAAVGGGACWGCSARASTCGCSSRGKGPCPSSTWAWWATL